MAPSLEESAIHLHLMATNDRVLADPLHLTNVIYNLLDNAVKYSLDGPQITISSRNENGNLVLTVEDKGVGMTREEAKQVFDKFYRVATGNRHDVKGFGIGLSYVKLIIKELGGSIDVESEPGKGSSFIVKLRNGA